MKFSVYQESRIGGRDNNEDRIAYCYSREALLLVVADGMGGHHYGEIAAQIAVQTLTHAFQEQVQPRIKDPFLFLQKGIANAHNAILDYSAEHWLKDSPRTTCVTCLIQDNIAYWAHAGDSRLYHIRGGRVISQTRDHTRVRHLIESGAITEKEAVIHPERNRIYSCLGGPNSPEIEFSYKTPLEAGDVIALMTDGLWGEVTLEQAATILTSGHLTLTGPRLLGLAEAHCSSDRCDNLSLLAVCWDESYTDTASAANVVSTLSMSIGEVTTIMDEFGRSPNAKYDLTEEEIEQAIAEIRDTINKYSKR